VSLAEQTRSFARLQHISHSRSSTYYEQKARRPADLANREFTTGRPNELCVADFTYVTTWKGFVYVAFLIDVFARMIVGWRVSASMSAELTLDAIVQALWARTINGGLVHHNERCPNITPAITLFQIAHTGYSSHPLLS
jgi:transposase InsO family protein